jgi:hypothetical protein
MYQEDTRRKASKWAFLAMGSVPPRLDKEDPIVTDVATTMTDKHDGTCEISSR